MASNMQHAILQEPFTKHVLIHEKRKKDYGFQRYLDDYDWLKYCD